MKNISSLLLLSFLLLEACTKDSTEKASSNTLYKDELAACECSVPTKDGTGEYIKAEFNGIPMCADVKGSFQNDFDNMLKYGLIKRSSGNTYYDNLYMIRYTKDGKFMMGIFMENTHLLTKQFPYNLPRANPETCEIGEFQLINQYKITSNTCFSCSWSDWHYLGSFFDGQLKYTADKYENGYLEGHFSGTILTGSGRNLTVTNGLFRIKLTPIQEDIIIP